MLLTVLTVGSAIFLALGGVGAAVAGVMQRKQDSEMQKSLIDYEHKMLGRRDGK